MASRRIIAITHSLNRTGAPLVFFDMVRVFSQQGDLVDVIAMEDGPLREDYETFGVSIRVADDFLENLPRWQKTFGQYDLAIVNTVVGIEAVYALNTTTVPTIWWIHEPEYWFQYYQTIFPKPEELHSNIHVYGVSPITNKFIRQYCGYDTGLLPLGVSDRPELSESGKNADSDKVKFVLPGTISKVKGQDILLEAIRLLPEDVRKQCEFLIFGNSSDGEGEYYELIKGGAALIDEVRLESGRPHDEALKCIVKADYLLAPSRNEPFPTIAAEALMFNTIPVLSSVCGIKDFLTEGEDCLIFQSENSSELCRTLMEAVRLKKEDTSRFDIMRTASRSTYDKCFSMNTFSHNVIEAMNMALGTETQNENIDSIIFSVDDDKKLVIDEVLKSPSQYCLLWDEDSRMVGNQDFFASATSKPYLDVDSYHVLVRKDIFREFVDSTDFSNIGNLIDGYISFASARYSDEYTVRHLRVLERAGEFLDQNDLSDSDQKWLSADFDILYFDRKCQFREEIGTLFKDPYYQEKLSPKQMIEAVLAEGTDTSEDELTIEDKLKYLRPDTYKEYEEMGDKLVDVNIDQAFLCYENAEYLCDDEKEKERIDRKRKELLDTGKVSVKKSAFVILSYNNKYLMQRCIESIYTNCNPESYHLIIFDNNSTDGVAEWLAGWGEGHDEAAVVLSDENLGFSGGCNAAAQNADDDEDIFLLNNDTRVPANALFWLRMGLYAADDIGAAGSIQNYFNNTRDEKVDFAAVEQYMEYGARKNVYTEGNLEQQAKLCGFALLIRRKVWDEVGGFDERFNPGYLEDDDISLGMINLGYRLVMVHNSFIYHAGSQSFIKRNDLDELYIAHRKLIIEKWGFDSAFFSSIMQDQVDYIESLADKGYTKDSSFSVLHINCGAGGMLAHLRYLYPKAELVGVEESDVIRKYAVTNIDIYGSAEALPKAVDEYDEVYRSQ